MPNHFESPAVPSTEDQEEKDPAEIENEVDLELVSLQRNIEGLQGALKDLPENSLEESMDYQNKRSIFDKMRMIVYGLSGLTGGLLAMRILKPEAVFKIDEAVTNFLNTDYNSVKLVSVMVLLVGLMFVIEEIKIRRKKSEK